MQTFTSDHEPGDLNDLTGTLSCFAHCKLPSLTAALDGDDGLEDYRMIVGSKRILFFDQHRDDLEPVSDDGPVRLICFNVQSLTIFTASERSCRIWDAILGSIKHVFSNITATEILAMCFDDRQRKFILGEASGLVSIFNYTNGSLMKVIFFCFV